MNKTMKHLWLTSLGIALLSSCSVSPWQFDWTGKARFDYPDGDPRRAGNNLNTVIQAPTPQPNGVQTALGQSASTTNMDELNVMYSAYPIPSGDQPFPTSIVIEKRGYQPAYIDATMSAIKLDSIPSTAYVRTIIVPNLTLNEDFGTFDSSDGLPGQCATDKRYDCILTVYSFDGSYEKSYMVKSHEFVMLDSIPLAKACCLVADINGTEFYSMPFILAKSNRTMSGQYIPVEIHVGVLP